MSKLNFNTYPIFHKIKTCICIIIIVEHLWLTNPTVFFKLHIQ